MAQPRRLVPKLVFLAAVGVVAVLTHVIWLTALGKALVSAGPPVPADAVVVLAGDMFGHRILKAAELVRNGYAPRVLVSGPYGAYGRYECDLAIPFAVDHGYPAEYFVRVPHVARSTREEADAVIPVLRRMGIHRYLLVTTDYHTSRAGRVFRARGPDLEMHVVASADEYFTTSGWWRNREGSKIFLTEWEKTLAARAGL